MHQDMGLLYLDERHDPYFSFILHKNYHTDICTGLDEYLVCNIATSARETRGNANKIMSVRQVHTSMRQKAFLYRGPGFWNEIPGYLKTISVFKTFKVRVSKKVHKLFGDHPT